jgi:hypothetical protein
MTEIIDKYDKYKDFLLQELMYIDSMFDLHIYLKNQHIDRVDILNISPAFFGLTEKALLECSAIRLCKLYDKDSKTITILKFLYFVEQNLRTIFKNEVHKEVREKVKEDNALLEKYQGKFNELKIVRDTSLAHNDACNLQQDYDMWAGRGIVIGDIHDLIKLGVNIINHYTHYSNDTFHSITATNKTDVENTLSILEKSDYIQKRKSK